jgi:hypothetical protein
VKLEFIRYPNESDPDFSYRIKRATRDLGIKILVPSAKGPGQVWTGVSFRTVETDNGTRYIYEAT